MADEARALALEAREQSSEHLQVILDHIKDVVLAVDEEGVIRTFNPTGERVFGYAEAEVVGQRIDLLIPEHHRRPRRERAAGAAASGGELRATPHSISPRASCGRGARTASASRRKLRSARRRRRGARCSCCACVMSPSGASPSRRCARARRATGCWSIMRPRRSWCSTSTPAASWTRTTRRRSSSGSSARSCCRSDRSTLSPPQQPDGGASEERARAYIQQALEGHIPVFEWTHCDCRGARDRVRGAPGASAERQAPAGARQHRRHLRAQARRAHGGRRAPRVRAGDAATRRAPKYWPPITRFVESAGVGTVCSVSVLTDDGRGFSYMVAPQLPEDLRVALERAGVDIRNGSCAAAVYLGRQVLVADLAKDPFWLERRERGARARACAPPGRRPSRPPVGKVLGLARGVPPRAGPADAGRVADHGARRAARRHRHRAQPRRRGAAQQRGEVPRPVREHRRGRLSERPRRAAAVGESGLRQHARLSQAPRSCTRCPAPRRSTGTRPTVPSSAAAWRRKGEIRDAEFLMRRRDGQQVVILENARAVRDAGGHITGYEGTIADITERKRAEQAVFAEKERAQVTLQSIGDAVISTDAEGRIEYINPVAESLTAWSLAEARGQPIGAVLQARQRAHARADRELARRRARPLRERRAGRSLGAHHARRATRWRSRSPPRPICDRSGQVIGAVVVFHDVTKERRLKRALVLAGESRCAHRAHQPARVRQPPARGAALGAARRGLVRAAVHRPRPVQGGQRHLRPPGRRPAAARRHGSAADPGARLGHHRAPGRR